MTDREASGAPGKRLPSCPRSPLIMVFVHVATNLVKAAHPGCKAKNCAVCGQLWRRKWFRFLSGLIGLKSRVWVKALTIEEWTSQRLNRKLGDYAWFALENGTRYTLTNNPVGEGWEERRADKALLYGFRNVDLSVRRSIGRGGAWAAPNNPEAEWEEVGATDANMPDVYAAARQSGLMDEDRSDSDGIYLRRPQWDDELGQRRWLRFLAEARIRPMEEFRAGPALDEMGWPIPPPALSTA